MRAIVLASVLLAPTALAGEMCIVDSEGLCCFPCDVVYELGGRGYSESGGPEACSNEVGAFAISSSDTDPFVNEGELPAFTSLFVWLYAGAPGGYGFAWGNATIESDMLILDYQSNGRSDWDPQTNLLSVSLDCEFGYHLLGEFTVIVPPTSVEEPIETGSWAEVKARWRE
jgi:hypothetical protein